MMPTLEYAIILAARAHRGEVHKTGQPYVLHVVRVMLRLDTDVEKIVAVLHDLVEENGIMLDHLRAKGYSEEILQALDCLSRREDEPYGHFIERVKANPIARRVKIADIEGNVELRRFSGLTEENMKRVKKYQNVLLQLRM